MCREVDALENRTRTGCSTGNTISKNIASIFSMTSVTYVTDCDMTSLFTGLDKVMDGGPQTSEVAEKTVPRKSRSVVGDKVVKLLDLSVFVQLDIDLLLWREERIASKRPMISALVEAWPPLQPLTETVMTDVLWTIPNAIETMTDPA